MNNKKIVILSMATLVLLATLPLIFLYKNNQTNDNNSNNKKTLLVDNFTPEFLSIEEKNKLGIPIDKKIQAVTRDEDGELTVYKVINEETDINIPSSMKLK